MFATATDRPHPKHREWNRRDAPLGDHRELLLIDPGDGVDRATSRGVIKARR
jgi:hypothetical protein